MDFYYLDKVSWQHSQALYHAAAYLNKEALFILRPATPYVSIGFHQDAVQEVDLDFTRENEIPVFRREVGGGAVYLDSGQLFYQLIVHKERTEIPENKIELYRRFLIPVVETYREFGVDAEYKPVNDILANGRKISGNGAAEINDMVVIVGNFILDFNYEMMSKCLRVPNEKFRDKLYKTLQDNLSTMLRETGSLPDVRKLGDALAERYESLLGPMKLKTSPDADLITKANALLRERDTDEWLFANDRRLTDKRQVKIRDGVYVVQNVLKAPGGLIRVTAVSVNDRLHDVHISGDFFFYPANALTDLERALEGTPANLENLTENIQAFYLERDVETPGILAEDFAKVFIHE
jgi:lipoate-protein ligase A